MLGTVPKKLRDIGLRTLLSMKYRYDKLHIVEDLSSDRFVEAKTHENIMFLKLNLVDEIKGN